MQRDRFGTLGLLAAAGTLLVILADRLIAEGLNSAGRFWFSASVRGTLLALVVVAAGLAAHRFGWSRDYVGRAWTLFFITYLGLFAAEMLRRFAPGEAMAYQVVLIAANVAAIGAYWLMSRSMSAAGLEYYGSPWRRIAYLTLAAILAVALVQKSILTATSAGSFVSALADLITFLLVAPLLLTAFAFRGGQLFWTYAFLTVGTFGWMFNQGASTVIRLAGGSDSPIRTGRIAGFAIACLFIAAAALAQWLAGARAKAEVAA